MSAEDLMAGVGKTALGVAMVRAEESRRSDRLFDDPYAAAFVAAVPNAFARERAAAVERAGGMARWGTVFWGHAAVRTRFFDDYLLDAADRGIRQTVLLAAGLDTRAYRLAWPSGMWVFELDRPDVLAFKQQVLAEQEAVPRCERQALGVDLREDWKALLIDSGQRPGEPTAWLAEGLLTYLAAEEADRLLTVVADLSAPGSRLAFEFGALGAEAMRAGARAMPAMAEYVELWKGGLPDAPDWLSQHGWRPEIHRHAEVARQYQRSVEAPSGAGFVTAIRTG